jgi:hypothetical protein
MLGTREYLGHGCTWIPAMCGAQLHNGPGSYRQVSIHVAFEFLGAGQNKGHEIALE